jgi:hypothetical protein
VLFSIDRPVSNFDRSTGSLPISRVSTPYLSIGKPTPVRRRLARHARRPPTTDRRSRAHVRRTSGGRAAQHPLRCGCGQA